MTNPIPQGYSSVTPYLIVDDASRALDFYARAFGAEEKFRMPMGDKIAHAEMQIGDSHVMLCDECAESGYSGPKSRGGPTATLLLYVEDVDSAFQKALDAGADEQRPVTDQFWGDRMGTLADPFGHHWSLATHVEDVPEEEMAERMKQFAERQAEPA